MTKLTLKSSTLSPEKKAKIDELKALHKKPVEEKPITFDDIKKGVTWLMKTYPLLFSKKYDKPLKIGIEKDIYEKGNLPYSRGVIRKAIKHYVHAPSYLESILANSHRFDLLGQEAGLVEDQHKANALELINKRKEKKNDKS